MTAIGHTLATAVVAEIVSKLPLSPKAKAAVGVPAALILHLAMDAIPHFDPGNLGSSFLTWGTPAFWWAVPDFLITAVFGIYLMRRYRPLWLLMVLMAFGVGQDILIGLADAGYLNGGLWPWFLAGHRWMHAWWTQWFDEPTIYWIHTRIGHVTNLATIALAGRYVYAHWQAEKTDLARLKRALEPETTRRRYQLPSSE